MKLGLQRARLDKLPLRERAERKRQRGQTRRKDQAEVDGQHEARVVAQPGHLLQAHERQRGDDHDRGAVEDARQRGLADGDGGGLPAAAQGGELGVGLAGGAVLRRQDGVHVDALADLLAAHEEDVEGACAGDGGEGDEAAEDELRSRGDAREARDEGVEAEGDGAGGADGEDVGLGDFGGGEGRGLVGVGVVDGDVEGLVGDLPEQGAGRLSGR